MVIPPFKKRHGLPSRGLPYGCEISYAQRQISCAPRLSHDTRPSCAGPARMMPLRSRQGKGAVLLVPYGRTATSPLSALVRFTTDVVHTSVRQCRVSRAGRVTMSNDVICVVNAILSRRSNGRDALLEIPILCISDVPPSLKTRPITSNKNRQRAI